MRKGNVPKFKPGDKAWVIEGPVMSFCPNPDRIGESVTIEGESQVPNFYHLVEFPGLWPVAFLCPM